MSSIFQIEWTVTSTENFAIMRPCARCGVVKPFLSSSKFRLNANGNRLDAWLIYRCTSCSHRWNRQIFERKPVDSLKCEVLDALQTNDAKLADQVARQASRLEGTIKGSSEFSIQMRWAGGRVGEGEWIQLTIRNPSACQTRLDRILAKGLGVTRKQLLGLASSGAMKLNTGSQKALKRPLAALTIVELPYNERLCRAAIRHEGIGQLPNRH